MLELSALPLLESSLCSLLGELVKRRSLFHSHCRLPAGEKRAMVEEGDDGREDSRSSLEGPAAGKSSAVSPEEGL